MMLRRALLLLLIPAVLSARRWTVMVYMGADNGLNVQAHANLDQMARVGPPADCEVIVQVDFPEEDRTPGGYRYRVAAGRLELLAELGTIDMADSSCLTDFAHFVSTNFPARSYALVMWDHGDGWPDGVAPSSIITDGGTGHVMGVAGGELRRALLGLRRQIGKPLEIIGFDACLMQMLEVAGEVRTCARYMLGAESLMPAAGWPYDSVLPVFATGTTRDVCTAVVERVGAAYADQNLAFSCLDLGAWDGLAGPLTAAVDREWSRDAVAAARSMVLVLPFDELRPGSAEYVDAADFLARLGGGPSVTDALARMVVARAASGTCAPATGVSVWFPRRYLPFKRQYRSYYELDFARTCPWLEFLNRAYGGDDVPPPVPTVRVAAGADPNQLRVWWDRCYDPLPVRYCLRRVDTGTVVFADSGAADSLWERVGFERTVEFSHSPPVCYFSGSGSETTHTMTLRAPFDLSRGALVSACLVFDTRETQDPLTGIIERNAVYLERSADRVGWQAFDSLYGPSAGWERHSYYLAPAGDSSAPDSCYLRLRFRVNSIEEFGVGLDDIEVRTFLRSPIDSVSLHEPERTVLFGNQRRGDYSFLVQAVDAAGNAGPVSELASAVVSDYARPGTLPAPAAGPAAIVCDLPESLRRVVTVRVFDMLGRQVQRFPPGYLPATLVWDGRDDRGRALPPGVYAVSIDGPGFQRRGKLVKLR